MATSTTSICVENKVDPSSSIDILSVEYYNHQHLDSSSNMKDMI